MGVTALGLLMLVAVNCVIMAQKKSEIPFLFPFIHLFTNFSGGQTELDVGRLCRSLGRGAEGSSTHSSTERKDSSGAVQRGGRPGFLSGNPGGARPSGAGSI